LHPDPAGGQWPHLLTAVDPAGLWQLLGREGFAHELRLEPGPASYRLGWPVVAMGPEKHLGYAVQWFAMATALVLLYLYFGWHNHNKRNAMAAATPLNVPEGRKARGRLQLLLILLVVLGPMILATGMYKLQFWVPEGAASTA
jgi:hypothetical protein